MAGQIRTRGGAVLLHRLGHLRDRDQARWDRAPARRGQWAFPWPLFEMFFAAHQYDHVLPLRLRRGEHGFPAHASGYVDDATGLPADPATPVAELVADLRDGDRYRIREDWWADREAWIRTHGGRVLPKRLFYYDGDLFTHLTPSGEVLGLAQWQRMPARLYADAVTRSGAGRYVGVGENGMYRGSTTADHLEVFLPAHTGRIHGRPARRP